MIIFPKSTLVGKPVPKTAFYRNLEVNAKIKQRFVDDVASVTWTAKIAPSTLNVADDVVTAIAKMQPMYAVLRDTSMKTDSTATNFEQIFKTYSPNTVTRIL